MNDRPDTAPGMPVQSRHGHGGHGLMMIACCIPMLAIAITLVVAGVASPGLLVGAIGCTVMMALMMRGMHGGDAHQGDGRLGDTRQSREESTP